jgi:NADH:ubiquinone reductase (H+-translocating)
MSMWQMHRAVILGAGPGALHAALELDRRLFGFLRRTDCEVVLVAPRDYHEVRPLLPEVAAGNRSPRNAMLPLSQLLGRRRVTIRQTTLLTLDLARQTLVTTDGVIDYRWLIVGLPGNQRTIPGSGEVWRATTLDEARRLAEAVAERFRQAAWKLDAAERDRLATVVVRGDGYNAAELAAWLATRVRALATDHRFPLGCGRVVLVAPGGRILPDGDRPLAEATAATLGRLGVDTRPGADIANRGESDVTLTTGEVILAGTVVDAGDDLAAPSLPRDAGAALDVHGRLVVGRDLRLPDHREVFAVGEGLAVSGEGINSLPRDWQVEREQSDTVAHNLAATLTGQPPREYRSAPRSPDVVLSLGPNETVAMVGGAVLTGWPAVSLRGLALVSYLESVGGASGLLGALASGRI